MGWVRALSLFSPLFFSPSLPSRRTPLSEHLEQARGLLLPVNSCVPPPPLKDRGESLRGGDNCTQAKKIRSSHPQSKTRGDWFLALI